MKYGRRDKLWLKLNIFVDKLACVTLASKFLLLFPPNLTDLHIYDAKSYHAITMDLCEKFQNFDRDYCNVQ